MRYNYTVLFEKSNYALIERGVNREYAVVYGLVPETERRYEGSDWDRTVDYATHTVAGLASMIDIFRYKTEEEYISRLRLEKLATQFKDALINTLITDCDATNEEIKELLHEMELNEYEMRFFGIGDDEE